MPDADMDSVGTRLSRLHDHDRLRRDKVKKRLSQVATAGEEDSGGFYNHRVRMSSMAELKEVAGLENNEERTRNWTIFQ